MANAERLYQHVVIVGGGAGGLELASPPEGGPSTTEIYDMI